MSIKFKKLNKTIIKCKKCPRLTNFIKKISIDKRKQNINENYLGKPVTGFGSLNAKLMILGLAPAAHGGTRTGRAFTGDKSGDFLFKSLFKVKISNQRLNPFGEWMISSDTGASFNNSTKVQTGVKNGNNNSSLWVSVVSDDTLEIGRAHV